MFDLRAIRDDAEGFDKGWARRNEASKEIGEAKRTRDEARASSLMAEVANLKAELPALEESEKELGERLDALLASLPNIPASDTPDGPDETGNVEVRRFGEPP